MVPTLYDSGSSHNGPGNCSDSQKIGATHWLTLGLLLPKVFAYYRTEIVATITLTVASNADTRSWDINSLVGQLKWYARIGHAAASLKVHVSEKRTQVGNSFNLHTVLIDLARELFAPHRRCELMEFFLDVARRVRITWLAFRHIAAP